MNIKELKAIIKEAVKESVREEVGLLLLEVKRSEYAQQLVEAPVQRTATAAGAAPKKSLKESFSKVNPIPSIPKTLPVVQLDEVQPDPYGGFGDFLADTAQNMDPNEFRQLAGGMGG